jgi:hypothetical protein
MDASFLLKYCFFDILNVYERKKIVRYYVCRHTVPVYLERRSVSLIEGSCDGGEDSDDDIGSLTAVTSPEEEAPRQARRLGSTAIRRRPGTIHLAKAVTNSVNH